MKIGFIGAGKVGTTLAMAFAENGLDVSGFWSRSHQSAAFAAGLTVTHVFSDIASLVRHSDVLFITVTDDAIHGIYDTLTHLPLEGKVLCHTSGVYSVDDVFPNRAAYGAFGMGIHPLTPIHNKTTEWRSLRKSSFSIEGDEEAIYPWIKILRDLHLEVKVVTQQFAQPKALATDLASQNVYESIGAQQSRMLTNLAPTLQQKAVVTTRTFERPKFEPASLRHSTLTSKPARQGYLASAFQCFEKARTKHPTTVVDLLKHWLLQYA